MAQVDITTVNGNVVIEWTGGLNLRKMTFGALSISTAPPEKIYFYEDGAYKTALYYAQINEIDGVAPTDYEDAVDKILALLPSAGGGSATSYDTATNYDTVGDLPITFDANTIHSISILSITGNTVITVDGEPTTLVEGQSTTINATALIDVAISIDSASGTFLATTLS
jgi:hypothetical protein